MVSIWIELPSVTCVASCQGVAEAEDAEAFGERIIHRAGLCHRDLDSWSEVLIKSPGETV